MKKFKVFINTLNLIYNIRLLNGTIKLKTQNGHFDIIAAVTFKATNGDMRASAMMYTTKSTIMLYQEEALI